MHTEITDTSDITTGVIYYDGSCRLCVGMVERFAEVLGRYGWRFRALQELGTAARLGIDEEVLLEEVRVLLPDGRVLGGVDALLGIAAGIPGVRHLCVARRVPGMMHVLRAAYGWVAMHRHCAGGACRVLRRSGWGGWVPLGVLPLLSLLARDHVPGWVFMWLIALAIYAGFKWLTYRQDAVSGSRIPFGIRMLYLWAWPGMSLRQFAALIPLEARGVSFWQWGAPVMKTLLGAGLVWVALPKLPVEMPLLQGWVGMVGVIMMLHFGVFHLLSLIYRRLGFDARPNMRAPLLAGSPADFWGRRWNTAFNILAHRYGFRVLLPKVGTSWALVLVFLGSGLLHEVVITLPAGGGYGLPTLYFLLQAVGMLCEHWWRLNRHPRTARLFAWSIILGPITCLFPPVFVLNVMLPMLRAIGAIPLMP